MLISVENEAAPAWFCNKPCRGGKQFCYQFVMLIAALFVILNVVKNLY